MDIYHSKISKGGAENVSDNINPFALSPLLGYRVHLEQCWPNIKDKIEIGFIKGTNGSEICFSQSLGWENKDWVSFFRVGIALPIALENCKKYGIKKFVFYCNDEIMEFTPEELEKFAFKKNNEKKTQSPFKWILNIKQIILKLLNLK